SAIGCQIVPIDTFPDFFLEKGIKRVNATRKRRHFFKVCVSHHSYLEINIQAMGSFLHNFLLFVGRWLWFEPDALQCDVVLRH
ncbi:MAG: hypothetical protein ACOCNO_03885, partial [Bacteroidales bacterium]